MEGKCICKKHFKLSQCNICEKGYSGSTCDQCGDGFHKKNDQCEGELIV